MNTNSPQPQVTGTPIAIALLTFFLNVLINLFSNQLSQLIPTNQQNVLKTLLLIFFVAAVAWYLTWYSKWMTPTRWVASLSAALLLVVAGCWLGIISAQSGLLTTSSSKTIMSYEDFSLRGDPTISRSQFAYVLKRAGVDLKTTNSDYLYDICTKYHIDPAVALAFFERTVSWGSIGEVLAKHDWGGRGDPATDSLRSFKTWEEGLNDWCADLTNDITYPGNVTLFTVVPTYFAVQSVDDALTVGKDLSDRIRGYRTLP